MRHLIGLLGTTALLALVAAAPASAEIGVTSVTSGAPLGQPPAQPERVLRVGIDVTANERVTTKVDDRAHLVFLDGTSLTVGPSSEVILDKFVYDANRKGGELALTATKGVFRLVGGNISKSNTVTIKTPSSTIGIRGGIVTLEVSNTGATRANFIYGDSMTVSGQGSTQTATRAGSQIHVEAGRPPSAPALIPAASMTSIAAFEKAPATVAQTTAATTPVVAAETRVSTITPQVTTAATTTTTTASTTTVATQVAAAPVVSIQTIESELDKSDFGRENSRLSRRELAAMDQRNNVKLNGGRENAVVAAASNRGASIATVLKAGLVAQRQVTNANALATQNPSTRNKRN
jgi:hypothetical protein